MLIETASPYLLGSILIIPLVLYASSFFYDSIFKKKYRGVFEFWTGLMLCLLAYNEWTYVVVYVFISFIDMIEFENDIPVSCGILFIYAHQFLFIFDGVNPYLGFLGIFFFINRLIRHAKQSKQKNQEIKQFIAFEKQTFIDHFRY